ncbi:MAG: hypothetical protein R3C70_17130 [Geminicoccaceae bacterium]
MPGETFGVHGHGRIVEKTLLRQGAGEKCRNITLAIADIAGFLQRAATEGDGRLRDIDDPVAGRHGIPSPVRILRRPSHIRILRWNSPIRILRWIVDL